VGKLTELSIRAEVDRRWELGGDGGAPKQTTMAVRDGGSISAEDRLNQARGEVEEVRG
jgi:hypothetical protein